MKIVYFYQDEFEKHYFSEKLEHNDVVFIKGTVQENFNFSDLEAEILCVFVQSHLGAEEMDRFPKLKMIATRSTGFDHIDLGEAQKRGVAVVNVPAYGENTVAEFAMGLLLTLSRKIYYAYNNVVERGDFSQKGLKGFDLKGKTVGVIGTGKIGKHFIKMIKGFDVNIIAFDVYPDKKFEKEFSFKYVDFDVLLNSSDIISIHVPHNPHTHHLINKDNISKIKKGSLLINTARGEVVETVALVEALERGILSGAGLDVLEEEGYMADETGLLFNEHSNPEELKIVLANQYLIDHPQVIITPHIAFNTQEAIERIYEITVKNIEFFEKGEPINLVN